MHSLPRVMRKRCDSYTLSPFRIVKAALSIGVNFCRSEPSFIARKILQHNSCVSALRHRCNKRYLRLFVIRSRFYIFKYF